MVRQLCAAWWIVLGFSAAQAVAQTSYTLVDPPTSVFTYPTSVSGTNVGGFYSATDGDGLSGDMGFFWDGTGFFRLVPPGATASVVSGVSGSSAVGYYGDAAGQDHAFFWNELSGSYTFLDPPGSTESNATGISGGVVTGDYLGNGGIHGFLWNGTTYTTLDPPGSTGTYPRVVNGNSVAGFYPSQSPLTPRHGFVWDGTTYTTFDPPDGTLGWYLNAVSGDRAVGACWSSTGATHAFIWDGTTFKTIDPPAATNYAGAFGFDGQYVVGWYGYVGGEGGFLWDGSTFTYFDCPGEMLAADGTTFVGQTGGSDGYEATIPEPAMLSLLALGGLALVRRRK